MGSNNLWFRKNWADISSARLKSTKAQIELDQARNSHAIEAAEAFLDLIKASEKLASFSDALIKSKNASAASIAWELRAWSNSIWAFVDFNRADEISAQFFLNHKLFDPIQHQRCHH